MHRQSSVSRPASKASVSSFAYQGTNAHCILGTFAGEAATIVAPQAPWQNRSFWFQVRVSP